jgi:hypothetical protein
MANAAATSPQMMLGALKVASIDARKPHDIIVDSSLPSSQSYGLEVLFN